jgi:hypothetical protein
MSVTNATVSPENPPGAPPMIRQALRLIRVSTEG